MSKSGLPLGLLLLALCMVTLMLMGQKPPQSNKPAAGVAPQPSPKIVFEAGITYGKGGGEALKLNMARPVDSQKAEKPLPCVVAIHGGGWAAGHRNHFNKLIRQIAARGYVAVTVTYRLAPKHRFPAQIEDVKCAVRYMRAHAKKYNIDPKRIGAVGMSAGAHLAMMLGAMDKDDGHEGAGGWAEQSSKVQAAVSFVGPTDLTHLNLPDQSKAILVNFLGGTRNDKLDTYAEASPITYVDQGDAPMLLFQGTKDPLIPNEQAYVMAKVLTKAGVPGRVELLLGQGHGWPDPHMARTLEATYAFFDRYLKP